MIEVILLEKIGRLGQIGQLVKVKPGYARNFLLPRRKALRATKENMAVFEAQRADIEARNADTRAAAEALAKKLDGQRFVLIRQASEVGQLFGSVTVRDIAEALKTGGFDIERQYVLLPAPLKHIGLTKVEVKLHPEVSATIVMNIARTEDEARLQEKTGQAAKASAAALEAEAAAKAQEALNNAMLEKTSEEAEATPA